MTLLGVGMSAPGCILDRDGRLSAGEGGAGGDDTRACKTDGDCGDEPNCQTPRCTDGVCEFLPKALGVPCGAAQDRKCDGQGVCVDCVGPGDCEAGLCENAVKQGGERCEQGACVPNDTTDCAPYECNATADNCLADCADGGVNDCAGGLLCNQDDQCVDSFYDGHPCAPGQCTSGFCVDGVCCDSACGGDCEQCAEIATGELDGTCAPVPSFTDPKDLCMDEIGCGDMGACAACGFSPTPPGDVMCPAACTGGCSAAPDFVCTITCDDTAPATTCDDTMVSCPAGWSCNIECINDHACRDAIINCPDDYDCLVDCADANHACQRMELNCSTFGPCQVACGGGNTCQDAIVECQHNACIGKCDGTNAPVFNENETACEIDCMP